MKLKITSFRGHHACDVAPEIGRAVFDKLTGRKNEPLSSAIRQSVPETFAELQALWSVGSFGYAAFAVGDDNELNVMNEFDTAAAEIVFIAPVAGG